MEAGKFNPEIKKPKEFLAQVANSEQDISECVDFLVEHYPPIVKKPKEQIKQGMLKNLVESKQQKLCYIKDPETSKIIAVAQISIHEGHKNKVAELANKFVLSEYRNLGLAKKLTQARIEIAKNENRDWVSAMVSRSDPAAIKTMLDQKFKIRKQLGVGPKIFVLSRILKSEEPELNVENFVLVESVNDLKKLKNEICIFADRQHLIDKALNSGYIGKAYLKKGSGNNVTDNMIYFELSEHAT
jgi:GNAT superfamily N-acetyltransferase